MPVSLDEHGDLYSKCIIIDIAGSEQKIVTPGSNYVHEQRLEEQTNIYNRPRLSLCDLVAQSAE